MRDLHGKQITTPHKHIITAKLLPHTHRKPMRVQIRSHRFNCRKTETYAGGWGDLEVQAQEMLKDLGYTLVAFGSTDNEYLFLVEEFLSFKDMESK